MNANKALRWAKEVRRQRSIAQWNTPPGAAAWTGNPRTVTMQHVRLLVTAALVGIHVANANSHAKVACRVWQDAGYVGGVPDLDTAWRALQHAEVVLRWAVAMRALDLFAAAHHFNAWAGMGMVAHPCTWRCGPHNCSHWQALVMYVARTVRRCTASVSWH